MVARADRSPQRFYSLSGQIQSERNAYYEKLERTQKGSVWRALPRRVMDVTEWLSWFLGALQRAVDQAHRTVDGILAKQRLWQRAAGLPINARQAKVLAFMPSSSSFKLTTSKWVAIAKCSSDTALRDIAELVANGLLRKSSAGGRSTSYELND